MSHHSRTSKPLWLIQPRLDAEEYRDKLIGSVVKYPLLPTEKRIPYHSTKIPRDLVPGLDPRPVQVRNVKFWSRRIKDAHVSASVSEILEGFLERAREHSNNSVATVARIWHMDSPGEKFTELLKHDQYFEELFELLRGNDNRGYFITDIVTLVNLDINEQSSRSKSAGGGLKIPVDPFTTGLRVGASGGFKDSAEIGYSATYEEETIVFLGYRLVRLEKVDGMKAKLGRMFFGQKHGLAVKDCMDYWPEMIEKPYEGNAEPFMAMIPTPATEDPPSNSNLHVEGAEKKKEAEEIEEIVRELGFDVEIVG